MTSIEDARDRVARAQDEKDGLYDEIRKKHGALADLDRDCGYERRSGQPAGPARKLRQAYNAATKELRLAKSDLARLKNEERQKPEVYEVGIREDREGITLTDVPDELAGELTGCGGKVLGPTEDGEGMIIELTPDRPGYTEATDRAAERAEKRITQVDLEGKPLELPGGIEETRKISRSRVYEDERFKLKISEDKLLELIGQGRSKQRTMVMNRLRVKPDEEIAVGDLEEAVERMMEALNIAGRELLSERTREAR
jgi:hypothetical protein